LATTKSFGDPFKFYISPQPGQPKTHRQKNESMNATLEDCARKIPLPKNSSTINLNFINLFRKEENAQQPTKLCEEVEIIATTNSKKMLFIICKKP
jgi:hypothetical protein